MKTYLLGLIGWALVFVGVFFMPATVFAAVGDHVGDIARGDFDGDGTEDLVVSSPRDDCGKGVIHIRSGTAVASWTRDTSGILGDAACDEYFGTVRPRA